jgi:two-component system OmpR family sensor kinase
VLQIGRILVENALVHTPPGTPCGVAASTAGARRSRTTARGSRARRAQQVFERFYRLDGTRASGSGLGLAIARELAEVMGGRIELDSQNGRSSRSSGRRLRRSCSPASRRAFST